MNKALKLAASLTGLFLLSACDFDAPPRNIEVEAPAWTESVDVNHVSKHSASIRNEFGERVRVSRPGTDLGNGLTATRDFWDLYVTDQNGVTCNWNSGERLERCWKPNPAYQQYMANK